MLYVCLIRDDMTRMTRLYFMRAMSDARADSGPSVVKLVQSDGGGDFHINGRFAKLC